MKLARLFLRLVVGGLFFGHGTQKLFGWFDGHGIDATAQMFDSIGMRPGRRNAYAAGVAEAAGGAALAAGIAPPLAAAVLTSTMLTAINRVHLKNGIWVTDGGFEYNLVLIAAALAVAEQESGAAGALFAAGAGAAGAVGAHLAAEAAVSESGGVPGQAGDPASGSANGAAESATTATA
jgi:putative oxidoreductase